MHLNPQQLRSLAAGSTIFLVLAADQLIKIAVKTHMVVGERITVTDWFKIFFVENHGMAFGMDFIGTVFLALFRMVAVAFFAYVLVKLIHRCASMGMIVCWSAVVAGAAGNIIDNCLYGLIFSDTGMGSMAQIVPFGQGYGTFLSGHVVDMFYFPLFKWPSWIPLLGGGTFFGAVFNLADAAISCGAVALLLFYRKYITLDFLIRGK